MSNGTVRVPIYATYRIINGKAVMVAAEYADIPTKEVAEVICKGFGLPTEQTEKIERTVTNG